MELYIVKQMKKEPPDDFTDMYYYPVIQRFYQYAATFIVKGNTYQLVGPDEEIKRILLEKIARYHGCLEYEYGDYNGLEFADFGEYVPISEDEPRLKEALGGTIPLSMPYHVVTSLTQRYFPVRNMSEVKQVMERYQAEEAKAKAGK